MTPAGRAKLISSTKNGWHTVEFADKTIIKYRSKEITPISGLVKNMAENIEKKVHGNRRSSKKVHKRPRRRSLKSRKRSLKIT